MKRIGKLTLKREMFLLCLAYTMIFTLVFILIFGSTLFSCKLSEMKEKLHGSNAQIKIYMDTLFQSGMDLLNYLENTLDLTNEDSQEQAKILRAFESVQTNMPQILGIFLGYADGSILMYDYVAPDGFVVQERPWYQQAAEKYPETAAAYPYQEYSTGEWRICTARAIADEAGGVAAVIAVDYAVDALYERAVMQSHYTSQSNYLIDEDGICIYHENKEFIGIDMLENLGDSAEMFQNDEGYIEYTFQGQKRVAYFHHLENSDNTLVSATNRSEVIQPAFLVVLRVLLVLVLLSIVMSLVLMMVFDRRYVAPVKSLKMRLSALLGGHSVAGTTQTYPNYEFSEIADSMEGLTKRTLNQKAEELNAILESSSDGILVLDRNNRILHHNAQLFTLWGISKNGDYQTYEDLNLPKRMLNEHESVPPAAQGTETELCYLKSGIILERYTRMLTERRHIDGILCVYRDATQKVKKEEQLREIANTDFLTGLNNRRYFTFLAAREFRRAQEAEETLALLLLDIDGFKRINDTYGHDVGDRALRAFAMHLRQCSRRSDILGRYGGEEFCVLLPQTGRELAVQIAQRVRGHFETTAIDYKGSKISWTVSIGVALNSAAIPSVEALIKHADVACYAAKQHGRNRVESYTEETLQ